ncbi:MAG: riboflavin synthase [Psychroflexus sp.]|nr:riboflavin synthase [Psychroflexus sp.]
MFTGIVESVGKVSKLRKEGSNQHISIAADFVDELKIDQSIAHNGVCLTVVDIQEKEYTVTAVDETLQKSNIGDLKENHLVNLERSVTMNQFLDGHLVQGHVDQTAVCEKIDFKNGSWEFTFKYDKNTDFVTIEKGSIAVNGISLTVVNSRDDRFSVAVIPYTYEHTNFKQMQAGDNVNLEFDVIGKYVQKLLDKRA